MAPKSRTLFVCLNFTRLNYTTHLKKLTTGNSVFIVSVINLLSKVTVTSCSFTNVSALLQVEALLKCVLTEVMLFSVVAFKTLTFHKVV